MPAGTVSCWLFLYIGNDRCVFELALFVLARCRPNRTCHCLVVAVVVVFLLLLLPSVSSKSVVAFAASLCLTRMLAYGLLSVMTLTELRCWLAWLVAVPEIEVGLEWSTLLKTLEESAAE